MPEAILLFALHDTKGSVRPSAFLSVDTALRGGVLGELLVRGAIRVRRDGAVRLTGTRDLTSPILLQALRTLEGNEEPSNVDRWLYLLKRRYPTLREAVGQSLVRRGALTPDVHDRESGLRDGSLLRTADPSIEKNMVKQVRLAVACGSDVPRRMGILIGLIHVCDLWSAFEDPVLTANGRGTGEWVLGRDPLCQAVRTAVHRVEGTFDL